MTTTLANAADLAAARFALRAGWDGAEALYGLDWSDPASVALECYDISIEYVDMSYYDEQHAEHGYCRTADHPGWCPTCTPGYTREGTLALMVDILTNASTAGEAVETPQCIVTTSPDPLCTCNWCTGS